MKILALLLILANVLLYALTGGYLGERPSPEAARVAQQLYPERIRIVGKGEEAPAAKAAAPDEAKPADETKAEADKPETAAADEAARAESKPTDSAQVCQSWDKLTLGEAEKLAAASEKFDAYQWQRKPSGSHDGAAWWVYIAPLADKAEADKKANELRNLGVGDFFLIQDGPNRNAISLGIFSVEKGAQERLAELKEKGVRSAHLGARPGKEGYYLIEASGPKAGMPKLLAAVSKLLPKVEAKSCK